MPIIGSSPKMKTVTVWARRSLAPPQGKTFRLCVSVTLWQIKFFLCLLPDLRYFIKMFDSLSSKLQNAFRNLRGLGKISESNVADSLREVRLALVEADVNFKVVRDFIERVKTKAIGAEVIQSVQPGQQIIKIINDELVELLGSQNASLNVGGSPTCILMVGLHGSGKT